MASESGGPPAAPKGAVPAPAGRLSGAELHAAILQQRTRLRSVGAPQAPAAPGGGAGPAGGVPPGGMQGLLAGVRRQHAAQQQEDEDGDVTAEFLKSAAAAKRQ